MAGVSFPGRLHDIGWRIMRSELNSAFPFLNKIKIGILNKYLVVEYVGPEDKDWLDASGLFGTGKERECVVINVEQAPPDYDGAEYNRALRLNPSSALLSEYLETCESPENT